MSEGNNNKNYCTWKYVRSDFFCCLADTKDLARLFFPWFILWSVRKFRKKRSFFYKIDSSFHALPFRAKRPLHSEVILLNAVIITIAEGGLVIRSAVSSSRRSNFREKSMFFLSTQGVSTVASTYACNACIRGVPRFIQQQDIDTQKEQRCWFCIDFHIRLLYVQDSSVGADEWRLLEEVGLNQPKKHDVSMMVTENTMVVSWCHRGSGNVQTGVLPTYTGWRVVRVTVTVRVRTGGYERVVRALKALAFSTETHDHDTVLSWYYHVFPQKMTGPPSALNFCRLEFILQEQHSGKIRCATSRVRIKIGRL